MTTEQSKLADCTDEMVRAGREAHHKHGCGAAREIYTAMLRAAPSPDTRVREALGEAIAVFAGMNDDEIDEELLPRLRTALTQPGAVEPTQAEKVCEEAYQVVGSMLSDLGQFDTERGQKILTNLSDARLVHDDILPWPSFEKSAPVAQPGAVVSPAVPDPFRRGAALDPATVEACAKVAEGPLYKEKYRGDDRHNWWREKQRSHDAQYGNGRHDAATAIRALIGQPARNAGHLVSSTNRTSGGE